MKNEQTVINPDACPIEGVQRMLQGKWTMVIIYHLGQGTLRFGELSRKMPQMTQANLTKQLRALEEFGLVHREVYKQVPPKVEYSLTEIGQKFMSVVDVMAVWGEEYYKLGNQNKET